MLPLIPVSRFISVSLFLKCRLLFIFLSVYGLLSAQTNNAARFFTQKMDNRSGLSNSAVNYLYQDSDNLLWVATWDGLNRFDGHQFHVFDYNKTGSTEAIGNNVIKYITEDKRGNTWIGTMEGVSRFEKKTGKFHNYFYTLHKQAGVTEHDFLLALDTAGIVYCFTQQYGLTRYDAARDTFQTVTLPRHPSGVNKFAIDGRNTFWLLNTTGKLEGYENEEAVFRPINNWDKGDIRNFFLVHGRLLMLDGVGRLWERKHGIGVVLPLAQFPAGVTDIGWYKNHYLVAWANRGCQVYDSLFRVSDFLDAELKHIQHSRVTAVTAGMQDVLWVGTDGNGVLKIYPSTKPFGAVATADNLMPYNRAVRSFCQVDDHLWVGTKGGGIMELPVSENVVESGGVRKYFTAPEVLDNNSVYALQQGADFLVYIGTDAKGITVYDRKSRRFIKWSSVKNNELYTSFGSVYAVLPDNDGSVWLGTSGYGLVHLKLRREGNGLSVALLKQYPFTNNETGPGNDIIYSLAAGSGNAIWIGCRYGGLSRLDKTTGRFTTYRAFEYEGSLSNNDVLSLCRDSRQRLWIGTSYGLNCIAEKELTGSKPAFKKLTTANGLPNNTVHGIVEDASGVVWASTNKGLARVIPETMAATWYQQSDGLQGNEFSDGAVWKNATGYLYMGGIDGFSYFLPENIKNTEWLPNLMVVNRHIGTLLVPDNSYTILQPSGHLSADYTIPRKDGFLEMDVKAVSFLNAEKCEYAWFLEGYDRIWHHSADGAGKISYTNLPPGNYRLKIKWSNGEGIWTKEQSFITVRVQQYPWLSWPALLGYAIILFWVAYTFYRYRRNRMEIKKELELEHRMRVREEELHQQRLGFFTNIAHELQTPLTLILGSAERSLEKGASYYNSVIHQQASRLTYLVQQLLDFRKAESDLPHIQYSYFAVSDLLQHLGAPFETLAGQQDKTYSRQIESGIAGWMDKDKLEKIVFNLLSNAFRHTPEQSAIVFSAKQLNSGELELKVSNSGCQLSKEQLEHLFIRFYTAGGQTGVAEKFGTGIGLAFTNQLVTLLKGSIEATSENNWVHFKVLLPVVKDEEITGTNVPGAVSSEKPSLLYRSVADWRQEASLVSTEEVNKRSYIEKVKDGDRRQVLIVEDEPAIRFLLQDILKEQYIIYEAANGKEALSFLQQHTPDLIISDIMMPEMDGLELCHRVKESPATCQIPFILLSAKDSIEHKTEGYEVGADAYIAKPFHAVHLLVRVRKLLESRDRMDEIFKNTAGLDLDSNAIPDADKVFIDSIVKLIEANLDDVELNAARIEKELSISKMQLYRKVKTLTSMTPAEFIKSIRLRHAAHLLATTNLNVSEIFFRTGFNSQSYFYREFKKRYDCAPNDYRTQQTIVS